MREYHPEAKQLKRDNDRTAALHTHPDASAWVDRAIESTIRERYHAVLDGTMGSPRSVLQRIKVFRDAGYEIEVRVLALNDCQSWLGVLKRYESEKSDRGAGRMTPREVHDEGYVGLVESLRRVTAIDDIRIGIYSRTGELYDSATHASRAAAIDALQNERNREWTPEERNAFDQELIEAIRAAWQRGADDETIGSYWALLKNRP